jgi:nucleoside-diphosphate-sugar epimerase
VICRLPFCGCRIFYGPGVEKSFLDGLFKAAAKGGTAYMIGPIETPHQFVYVPDVGPVVMRRTLAAAVAEGVKRVPLGGVRATSYEEWLRASLEAARD